MRGSTRFIPLLIAVFVFGFGARGAGAQDSPSSLYVPLIGISSVPDPLALPNGPGNVTYHYAVKNFLQEYPLTDVQVDDNKCSPAKFVEGDDNHDGKLDYSETWRYTCTTRLSETTQSVATAIGTANNLPAAHKAYATVVVGSDAAAPLVNIINITKVAYPLTLPVEGGDITFTYRVNNPGVVPLSDVRVSDDKCSAMSSKLGDTNGNNLLDINEVWAYTCTTHLTQTTTNTVSVEASAHGLKAVGYATITVTVKLPSSGIVTGVPNLPETGARPTAKNIIWAIMSVILAALIIFFFLIQKRKARKSKKKSVFHLRILAVVILSAGIVVAGAYLLLKPRSTKQDTLSTPSSSSDRVALNDQGFGWKYPTVKFPTLGAGEIAYSDIRDPGGIPQGLPVRLKVPIIGVNSAVEDAFITPDGRMDVPAGSEDVAWFALGPHPGQVGSAVIGGHFGISDGVPFVFYDLDKLKIGDKVYIVNDKDETLSFVVRRVELFERTADATTVFTSDDGLAHLNLITCEGIWNQSNGLYPQRRVVFTDAISVEGASEAVAAFHRSLAFGARGADVTELQTALVQKGLLKIPPRVAKGYYGALTRAAVAKYQKSVGLPANGVFALATRAKLIPDPGSTAVLPTAGPGSSETEEDVSVLVQTFFAGPIDGFITTLLLLSILGVTLLILRQRSRRL